ncbi:MAG: hypothetical protein JW862_18675, partial [Anaerolineales bacterium]|nr:hypothetical protein [Anaerolineales bacterium]
AGASTNAPVVTLAVETGAKDDHRGAQPFNQLSLQIYRAQDARIEALDLRFQPTSALTISLTDPYRLLIQPAARQYVYVYQLGTAGELQALHNANPLQSSSDIYLPNETDWFYLTGANGPNLLYVLASDQELYDLEQRYAQYAQATSTVEARQAARAELLKLIEDCADRSNCQLYQLAFTLQSPD